jgi:site-specific DNA recombinase
MKVALYARYSSDQQRDASIVDQLNACRAFAERQAWTVAHEFSDAAQSGATLLRSGFQALLQLALQRRVDIVLAESLDRFSRDQEDIAGLFKRLTFVGVQLVTLSEGEIGHLHVGLKGTMNALYLKDLAEKTRRGLKGRVQAGKSGGGLCYGYAVVNGSTGARVPAPAEVAIVQRVFRSFVEGMSPKAIAKRLNAEGILAPSRRPWNPSTINGNVVRGTGLLNNELYIGRLIWNRLRYLKDPDTGKRVSRLNARELWVTTEVPELRIIDDALWQAVKARQEKMRRALSKAGFLGRAKRAIYLFSGLTRCARCGSGYSMFNRARLACSGARERGICTNRLTIRREEVETRVLRAMQERLWRAEPFDAYCRRLTERLNQLRQDERAAAAVGAQELARVEREIAELVRLLKEGLDSPSVREELLVLERRKGALASRPAVTPRPILHPNMADLYRQKVTGLRDALSKEESRREAADLLRGLVDEIRLTPTDDGRELTIAVKGNLGGVLAAAGLPSAASCDGCGGGI